MELASSDPDIQTLLGRIMDETLELQPEFQRGQVWSDSKQRKLIDTILRDWHIPPIHLVRQEGNTDVVLDGQQRLSAILRFWKGDLRIDGDIEPADPSIKALDGFAYSELPPDIKRHFDRYSIRVFTIKHYRPEEPFELFYRLNQPATLTSPEQRNAFFGEPRTQVRDLVGWATKNGLARDRVGFSNSRMAFDDVFARLLLTLERGTIRTKVTAQDLTTRYRNDNGFPSNVIERAKSAASLLLDGPALDSRRVRFNKATLYSWLVFAAELKSASTMKAGEGSRITSDVLAFFFEAMHRGLDVRESTQAAFAGWTPLKQSVQHHLMRMYTERATARVADVSSVLIRDAVIWLFFSSALNESYLFLKPARASLLASIRASVAKGAVDESAFLALLDSMNWGSEI